MKSFDIVQALRKTQLLNIDARIENTLVAIDMVNFLPDEAFVRRLEIWRNKGKRVPHCGTVACLGGWVAQHPYFRAKGVRADRGGAPKLAGNPFSGARQVAMNLFGDSDLFAMRFDSNFKKTDKAVALERLQNVLNKALAERARLVKRLEG